MADKIIDNSKLHNSNIITEDRITNPRKLESGDIVAFNYRGKNSTDKRPLVLVLNSSYQGKLHGLALKLMSEQELYELSKMTKTTLSAKIAKLTKLRFNKLSADIGNPYTFYNRKLKPFLNSKVKENVYRTYFLSGISGTTKIDYRFKDMVKDKKTRREIEKAEAKRKKEKFNKLRKDAKKREILKKKQEMKARRNKR